MAWIYLYYIYAHYLLHILFHASVSIFAAYTCITIYILCSAAFCCMLTHTLLFCIYTAFCIYCIYFIIASLYHGLCLIHYLNYLFHAYTKYSNYSYTFFFGHMISGYIHSSFHTTSQSCLCLLLNYFYTIVVHCSYLFCVCFI